MFTAFFYRLKDKGLPVSLNEWMTLMEGLDKGLEHASLTGFYYLARAVLVKTEADYDRFDQAFLQYFKGIETVEELPQELLDWLSDPAPQADYDKDEVDRRMAELELEDLKRMLEERLAEGEENLASRESLWWEVPESGIEWYRAHADGVVTAPVNWLYADDAGEGYELMQQYLEGGMGLDEMLREIDHKVQMMLLEGN